MGGDGGHHHETEEAKQIREAYNMRNSGGGYVSTESSKDYIALPSSAGTVWVDLSEFEENHGDSVFAAAGLDGQGRERHSQSSFRSRETPENSFMRRTVVDPTTHGVGTLLARMGVTRRRGSATTHGDPADHNSRQPTIEHGKRFFGGSRRTREGSGMSVGTDDPGSQSTLEGEGHGKDAVEEEALALELLRFRLPHKQGAEEAKSSATRAAKMCEAYVAQEMQVRQMWRIGMGNAPGLKAEIAKLHATERAKLALREFEEAAAIRTKLWSDARTQHGGEAEPTSPAATNSPAGVRDDLDSPGGRDRPGSPSSDFGGARDGSPRAGSPKHGRARVKRGSNGGLFGWLVGKKPRTETAPGYGALRL